MNEIKPNKNKKSWRKNWKLIQMKTNKKPKQKKKKEKRKKKQQQQQEEK